MFDTIEGCRAELQNINSQLNSKNQEHGEKFAQFSVVNGEQAYGLDRSAQIASLTAEIWEIQKSQETLRYKKIYLEDRLRQLGG